MNKENKPREYDLVLGGNNPLPVDGLVLGGIEGVKKRLESNNIEIVKAALTDAIKYGKEGEDLLFEIIETKNHNRLWGVLNYLWKLFDKDRQEKLITSLSKLFKDYDWNNWRKNNLHIEINLSGIDLIEVNLSKINFHKANFQRANLGGTNLNEANLSEANLEKAYLEFATLKKANLSKANLTNAYLGDTDFQGANLTKIKLNNTI